MQLLRDATVMSAIAAGVDYGITPKRLTPGLGADFVQGIDSRRLCELGSGSCCGNVNLRALAIKAPRWFYA
jgi:hypothetical protein